MAYSGRTMTLELGVLRRERDVPREKAARSFNASFRLHHREHAFTAPRGVTGLVLNIFEIAEACFVAKGLALFDLTCEPALATAAGCALYIRHV